MSTSDCPACGANTFVAGGGSCARCGYAATESNRCPHCNAVARAEGVGKDAVCVLCGGLRIPSNLGGDTAKAALREQKRALANARVASTATVLQAVVAAVVTLVGLGVAPTSIVAKAILAVVAAIPILLALRSRTRATKARANAADAGRRAWIAAAEDATGRSREGVSVAGLAKTLGIEPAEAEGLLTELAVHDRTRIDVGEDAEIRYSVGTSAREDSLLEDNPSDDRSSSEPEGRAPR